MRKLIPFFLLLLPIFCIANDKFLFNYFPIDVWGNIDFAVKWFNYIAIMCNVKVNNSNINLFVVAITLCSLFSIWSLFQSGLAGGIREAIGNVVLTLFLIVMTVSSGVTVTILDARVKNGGAVVGATSRKEVANVPYPIAFMASAFSNFTSYMIKKTEVILAEQNAPLYTEVGMLRHLYFAVPKTDPFMKYENTRAWKSEFQNYIEHCFLEFADEEDMLKLQNQFTFDTINPALMHSPVMTANGGRLATYKGEPCTNHYQNLVTNWDAIKGRVEVDIDKAFELTPQTLAVMQVKAPYNKQEVQDQVMGLGNFKNYIVQPLIQDMARVATLSKNLGSGGGVSGTSALTASESYLQTKRADGSALADWLTNSRLIEQAYLIFSTLAYGLFPLIILFAIPRTLKGKVRVLASYIGGCMGVSLMPFGLMIAHTIATRDIFSEAQKITGAGGEYFIGYEHYSNMLDQAYVSSLLAGILAITIPTVLMTGGVISFLNLAGRAMASGVGNVESTMSEVAQAQMDQKTGHTAGDLAMASMMSDIQQSTATKLGDWQQMEGENAHGGSVAYAQAGQQAEYNNALGSAIKGNELDYQKSGAWQGAKSAGQAMEIGDRYSKGFGQASGQALAEGAGRIAGTQEVANAKGAYAGGFMNKDGELSTSQGNLMEIGATNNARANYNKIAGMGLGGYYNSSQMSNLQYATQAGMYQQFGQGAGFKDAYGDNFNAFAEDSRTLAGQKYAETQGNALAFDTTYGKDKLGDYAKDVGALSTQKLLDTQGKAKPAHKFLESKEAREEYVSAVAENAGNQIEGTIGTAEGAIKGKESFKEKVSEALKNNANMSEEEKTQAKEALANPARIMARIAQQSEFDVTGTKLEEKMNSNTNKAIEAITPKTNAEIEKTAKENVAKMMQDARESGKLDQYMETKQGKEEFAKYQNIYGMQGTANGNVAMRTLSELREGFKKQLEGRIEEKLLRDEYIKGTRDNMLLSANYNENLSNIRKDVASNGMENAINAVAGQMSMSMAKSFSEQGVSLNSALSSGYINQQGTLTSQGKQGLSYQEGMKYGSIMNTASAMNSASFGSALQQTGLSGADINDIMSKSGTARANALAQKTATAQFSGTVRGRSFNIRMGADGGEFNASFDSSVNVKGGYNTDMGSALGAMGWAMGGVSGMRVAGGIKTAYEGVAGLADVATNFIPGGKLYKNISGIANFASKGKIGSSLKGK